MGFGDEGGQGSQRVVGPRRKLIIASNSSFRRILHNACELLANLYVLLCVRWKTPEDGQRNCPKHIEFYSKNKFEKLVHLVGFTYYKMHGHLNVEKYIWPSLQRSFVLHKFVPPSHFGTHLIPVQPTWRRRHQVTPQHYNRLFLHFVGTRNTVTRRRKLRIWICRCWENDRM